MEKQFEAFFKQLFLKQAELVATNPNAINISKLYLYTDIYQAYCYCQPKKGVTKEEEIKEFFVKLFENRFGYVPDTSAGELL